MQDDFDCPSTTGINICDLPSKFLTALASCTVCKYFLKPTYQVVYGDSIHSVGGRPWSVIAVVLVVFYSLQAAKDGLKLHFHRCCWINKRQLILISVSTRTIVVNSGAREPEVGRGLLFIPEEAVGG